MGNEIPVHGSILGKHIYTRACRPKENGFSTGVLGKGNLAKIIIISLTILTRNDAGFLMDGRKQRHGMAWKGRKRGMEMEMIYFSRGTRGFKSSCFMFLFASIASEKDTNHFIQESLESYSTRNPSERDITASLRSSCHMCLVTFKYHHTSPPTTIPRPCT